VANAPHPHRQNSPPPQCAPHRHCSACVPRSSKLKPRKLFLANIIIRPTIRDGPTDGGEPLVV
jgi:hypothetical protein